MAKSFKIESKQLPPEIREVWQRDVDRLAEALVEIQTAHAQIDGWRLSIEMCDEEGRDLSLSERIADLCLLINRLQREHTEMQKALRKIHHVAVDNPYDYEAVAEIAEQVSRQALMTLGERPEIKDG